MIQILPDAVDDKFISPMVILSMEAVYEP